MMHIIYFLIRLRKYAFTKKFWILLTIKLRRRYKIFISNIFGFPFTIVDSASFVGMYTEIFLKEIYKFESKNIKPIIIDCGSNVGVSILYFKNLYPQSIITAFEADPKIFQVLETNIRNCGYSSINLFCKAVFNRETTMNFKPDFTDGGHLNIMNNLLNDGIEVKTVRLREYLNQNIDFLKIDIEGAEYEVLQDISDLLVNVERIFIEYHSFAYENQNLQLILDILNKAGFRYYLDQTTLFSANPFLKINTSNGLDNLINIFGYRLNNNAQI